MSYQSDSVRIAAEYLDEYCDVPDWRKKINLSILRMSSLSSCILGQIYGQYGIGEQRLRNNSGENDWDNVAEAFESFDEEWREYLQKFQPAPLTLQSEWNYASANFLSPVKIHHVFVSANSVTYVVYSQLEKEMKVLSESDFRMTFKPIVKPKYVEGQLYRGTDNVVLMYSATAYYGGPGFYLLNDGTYASVEYFEQDYSPIKPIGAAKHEGKPVIAKIG
jgi:hypothetical protein